MTSKIFIFFTVVFLLSLVVVGWYFSDMYIDKAPSASAKGAEFFLDKDFKSSSSDTGGQKKRGLESFEVWLKEKISQYTQ